MFARPVLLSLLTLCPLLLSAQDRPTAARALGVIASSMNPEFARNVVEISGEHGTTQPRVWRFVIKDPAARSGIRVVEIEDGRIAMQQTPVRRADMPAEPPAIDGLSLKVDSDTAFSIANQQADKAGMGFDSADYLLRLDNSGQPAWTLSLNRGSRSIATIYISAMNGRVLRTENLYASQPANTPRKHKDMVKADELPMKDDDISREEDGFFHSVEDGFDRTGYYIERSARTVGATLQEFFTGRRTIDRKYRRSSSEDN